MDDGINMGLLIGILSGMLPEVDPSDIESYVNAWLTAHPEATTTVQDGSITLAKLAADLAAKINSITSLSDEIVNVQTAFNVNENGGVLNIPFKNGYYSKVESTPVPYHITLTNYTTYCSIPPAFPITVSAGDVLTIDSAYTVTALNKVSRDAVGTLVTEAYNTQLTEINTNHVYTFPVDGLYVMSIRKSVDGAYVAFTPDELTGKITLTASPATKAISDEVTYTDNRLVASVMGEHYYADFVQGSIDRIATGSSYLKHSANSSICSTALNKPLVIFKGDTIDIDSEYKITVCNKVEIDSTGVKLIGQISDIVGASHYTFKESGLYLLLVRKPKPNASTYLDFGYMELRDKIAITARGLNNVISSDPQKPLNPYANLYWGTEYITSCHAHCLNTIAGLIQAGYTAIIPTNYRPPKPYYPLKAFYPNVESVEDYLAAPNTEIGANVAPNKPAHFCNPGSFFACGTDSSATYTGTLDDMINDCRNSRKGWFLGGVIINHPSWSSLTAADMIPALQKYSDILGIEFYNYGCEVSDQNGWALTQWDAILASGVQCFGFAGPDHALETSATDNTPYGFLHVLPACPTDDALLAAIGSGRFYASLYNDGLKFTRIGKTSSKISVTATAPTSDNPTIKFVTAQGESTVNGLTGEYTFSQSDIYVRVEVSNGNNVLYSNAIML